DTVCAGSEVTLQSSASGGIGNYLYQWSSVPSGFTNAGASAIDSPTVSTIYILTISSGGCTHHDSVDVFVHPLPNSTFAIDTSLCIAEVAGVVYTGGNTSGLQFDWNFSGGQIQSGSGAGPYQVKWDQSGIYSVTLTVTDANGCTSSSTKLINVHPNP